MTQYKSVYEGPPNGRYCSDGGKDEAFKKNPTDHYLALCVFICLLKGVYRGGA